MDGDDKQGQATRLFLAHRTQIEALIYRRVRCRATAADLVQDLFLRLFGRDLPHGRVLPTGGALGYLLRSARNLAIDHLRAERRHAELLDGIQPVQQPGGAPLPDAEAAGREELARLAAVLRALPARQRHAFLLHKVHGRTYPEIARALGVSLSTVEKDMHRTLAACKAALAEQPPSGRNGRGDER